MRIEAHHGARPIRMMAGHEHAIVAFDPDPSTVPQIQGGVELQHITSVYIDNGDPTGQKTNQFISQMTMQPRTSPVVPDIIETRRGYLLLFKLNDPWYGQFANMLVTKLPKYGITANVDSNGTMPHISLAYGRPDDLRQQWQKLRLSEWKGVTMKGPTVYDPQARALPKLTTSAAPVDSDTYLLTLSQF